MPASGSQNGDPQRSRPSAGARFEALVRKEEHNDLDDASFESCLDEAPPHPRPYFVAGGRATLLFAIAVLALVLYRRRVVDTVGRDPQPFTDMGVAISAGSGAALQVIEEVSVWPGYVTESGVTQASIVAYTPASQDGNCIDSTGNEFDQFRKDSETIGSCKVMCAEIPECVGFTYLSNQSACLIHTDNQAPTSLHHWTSSNTGHAGRGTPVAGKGDVPGARCYIRDPCSHYSRIQLNNVKRNNLGGRGPDKGDEGLVYQGLYIQPHGQDAPVPIEVHVNAMSSYTPNAAWENGFTKPGKSGGRFQTINIGGGTSVKLRFRVTDSHQIPFPLKSFVMTFFDLDTGLNRSTIESVEVNRLYSYFLTEGTEVVATDVSRASYKYTALSQTRCATGNLRVKGAEGLSIVTAGEAQVLCDSDALCGGFQFHPDWKGGTVPEFFDTQYDCDTRQASTGWTAYLTMKDNSWVFTGSMHGTGADNPVDPTFLTHQQRNRAVTFRFVNVHEFNVTLASTKGHMPRYFPFLASPSIVCALDIAGDTVNPSTIREVSVITAAPPGGTTRAPPSTTTATTAGIGPHGVPAGAIPEPAFSSVVRGATPHDVNQVGGAAYSPYPEQCCLKIASWVTGLCSSNKPWWCNYNRPPAGLGGDYGAHGAPPGRVTV